jgi:GDP-4-dehydro-6-deoxy-D-mannose reductase
MLISMSETHNIRVEIDNTKLRAIDVKVIYGDNSKLRNHTGWSPEYSLEKSLEDTLKYWKRKIS